MGAAGAVKFTPIKFKIYAKLAGANQTNILAGTSLQISSINVFSGERSVSYGEKFFEELRTKMEGGHVRARTLSDAIVDMRKVLKSVMEDDED
ncbi:hypothetical protein J437_LFUL010504 [Ladona fulva]|uniref:Uncharacterized protein n=1 Tax=Ladona fulva TaxID=123851 RepID=A0A8K0P4P0_LADFU|nr:hypothetical protein J437_LFUL010504 [Ladona fulva]